MLTCNSTHTTVTVKLGEVSMTLSARRNCAPTAIPDAIAAHVASMLREAEIAKYDGITIKALCGDRVVEFKWNGDIGDLASALSDYLLAAAPPPPVAKVVPIVPPELTVIAPPGATAEIVDARSLVFTPESAPGEAPSDPRGGHAPGYQPKRNKRR